MATRPNRRPKTPRPNTRPNTPRPTYDPSIYSGDSTIPVEWIDPIGGFTVNVDDIGDVRRLRELLKEREEVCKKQHAKLQKYMT